MRVSFYIILIFAVSTVYPLGADESPPVKRMPPSAVEGLDYLIEFVDPSTAAPFDPNRLAGLIDYVRTPRPDGIAPPVAGRSLYKR